MKAAPEVSQGNIELYEKLLADKEANLNRWLTFIAGVFTLLTIIPAFLVYLANQAKTEAVKKAAEVREEVEDAKKAAVAAAAAAAKASEQATKVAEDLDERRAQDKQRDKQRDEQERKLDRFRFLSQQAAMFLDQKEYTEAIQLYSEILDAPDVPSNWKAQSTLPSSLSCISKVSRPFRWNNCTRL